MSNEDNSNETVNESEEAASPAVEANESAPNAAGNAISKVLELKESNPKVFFGGIGGLVLVILIVSMMGGGGGSKHLPASKMVNLSIGQTYSLKGVNSYDPMATIRLVAVPGSMAAYDEGEDEDGANSCKHMPQGTKVKLVQVQDASGMGKSAEVEIVSGDCAGRKGWTTANNLK